MEKRGIGVEVLGVPNILPDDRIVDKLTIHFLRPRHGGGEVQRVLYPSYLPGRALVIFEDPEVAGRVVRQSRHVLEIDKQRFTLQVKAADKPETDLPVEASLDLSMFPDQEEVRRLLTSCGFQTTDLHAGQVRVRGSFMMLAGVKAQMEKCLKSQTRHHHASSPTPVVVNGSHGYSSGGVPKYRDDGNRSPLVEHDYTLLSSQIGGSGSPYVPPSSPEDEGGRRSLTPDRPRSPRPDCECFVVDTDVLEYAERFMVKDIAGILVNHNTIMNVSHDGATSKVILSGKSVKTAEGKMQSLLHSLTKTLRTQDILLADLDHKSQVSVARRLKEYRDVYPEVLVRQVDDTVRLVGPSLDIYEFQRGVLGKPVDQSAGARPGRTMDKSLRRRSSSLPRTLMKNHAGRAHDDDDTTASSEVQPAGAREYRPSTYQDERGGRGAGVVDMGAGAVVKRGAAPARGRSHSETRDPAAECATAAQRQGEKGSTKAAAARQTTSPMDKIKKSLNPERMKQLLSGRSMKH